FGRKDRDAVQEQREVEAVLVILAVAELAHHPEQVRLIQPPRLLVEPARRPKIGELELDPRILDAIAQDVERAPPLDFGSKTLDELLPHGCAVVVLELLPFLGLRRENEVRHVTRQQAESAIVILWTAPAVEARHVIAIRTRRLA